MLTDEMIEILEKQRLGFVATVDADGAPCVSPKGTFVVVDSSTIAFGDIRSPGTIRHLRVDQRTEVNFVDPLVRKGFRAKGNAAIVEPDTDEFEALIPHFSRWGTLAERIARIVLIRITSAKMVRSPAYDDGATEQELRDAWVKTLIG